MKWLALALLAALSACCGDNEPECTAAQNRALGGMISGPLYPAPRQSSPVFVSCTRNGGVVNCIGQ